MKSSLDGADEKTMQEEFHKLHWEISRLKKKAGIAHDQRTVAIAQAAELRTRCKIAERGLQALEEDAKRYRFLKRLGCEPALEIIKCWETDVWDEKIDKARGHR